MKYVLLIYTDEKVEAAMSEAEQKASYDAYFAFTNDVRARSQYVGGEALHPIRQQAAVGGIVDIRLHHGAVGA
jgi:hypothetical protein